MHKVINKARELLLQQDITSFTLDIPRMRFKETIIFDTFQNYVKLTGLSASTFNQLKDGCTILKNDTHIILTHKQIPIKLHRSSPLKQNRRINWTLAHEVGHIILGHTKDGEEEERAANSFASELLMPELVILELQRKLNRSLTPTQISKLFSVSESAAITRVKQIEKKEFFSAVLKKEIMEKYKKLIDDYVKNAINSTKCH